MPESAWTQDLECKKSRMLAKEVECAVGRQNRAHKLVGNCVSRFRYMSKFCPGRVLLRRVPLSSKHTRLGMYDLLFSFSDASKGLRYYYTKMALNEDGSVNQEIGLPNLRTRPPSTREMLG